MTAHPLITIILSDGFNEVALPKGATLHHADAEGYKVSLLFKADQETELEYRQFYVAFDNTPTDYNQGILRLLKALTFSDKTALALVYEVYPYESASS